MDADIIEAVMLFGASFSSQMRSISEVTRFWLIVRLAYGSRRCASVGK